MIYEGSNGIVFKATTRENGAVVDLRGASALIKFKAGARRFEKQAVITDGENGICETELNADDLVSSGYYEYQIEYSFPNDRTVLSDKKAFYVGKKI